MKTGYVAILCLMIFSSGSIMAADSTGVASERRFSFSPSLGLTLNSSRVDGVKKSSFQWLATLDAGFSYTGEKFDFSSKLYAAYGETKQQGAGSEKLQDLLIVTLTPSVRIIKFPAIRLFLETTAETSFRKGELNSQETGFLDPVFLYQTLFLGQKHYSPEKNDKTRWSLTYGVGYSFQQTFNKNFRVVNDLSGGNSEFESGFSALTDFALESDIGKDFTLDVSLKGVVLARGSLRDGLPSARRSLLIRSGIFYKKTGLEYNYYYLMDPNLSLFKKIDHSLMFTLRF